MKVNSFWDGPRLSTLENVCIASFLRNGIGFNLYAYDEPANVPAGTVLRDAAEILPRSKVFRYSAGSFNLGSIAGFSNLFRYELIARQGGWWVDTDVCCVRSFDVEQPEAYFVEESKEEAFRVASAMFKAPAGAPVVVCCRELFREKDVTRVVHGETGPALLSEAVVNARRQGCVLCSDVYFPVPWWDYRRLFFDEELRLDHCFTVHFWNAMLAADNLDKDAAYPPHSAFEQIKRAYL